MSSGKFKYSSKSLVWLVAIVRIFSAISILLNHFWGLIFYWIMDILDTYILLGRGGLSRMQYHHLDKYWDWLGYIFMLIVGFQSPIFVFLFGLLVYRLIGQTLFIKTKQTKFFIMFPNFFEITFFWFVFLKKLGLNLKSLEPKHWLWLVALFVFQEIREVWLHRLWPSYLKKSGYPEWMRKIGYKKRIIWK